MYYWLEFPSGRMQMALVVLVLVVMLAVSCSGQRLQVNLIRSQPNQYRLTCQQFVSSAGVFRDVSAAAVEWYMSSDVPVTLNDRVSVSGANLDIRQAGPGDENNYICCINNRAVCSGNKPVRSE